MEADAGVGGIGGGGMPGVGSTPSGISTSVAAGGGGGGPEADVTPGAGSEDFSSITWSKRRLTGLIEWKGCNFFYYTERHRLV